MIPSRTVSANCPALPRVMWPKYCSFSFVTLPINSLSRPNSVNIESFVLCSCHEMLSIFLKHHISKASILFLSDFFTKFNKFYKRKSLILFSNYAVKRDYTATTLCYGYAATLETDSTLDNSNVFERSSCLSPKNYHLFF